MTVDELTEYGLNRMDDEAIRAFLTTHSVGVLGLPDDGAPSLRPLSYVYDPDADHLYLLYVVGSASRKEVASDRADHARFLVFSTEGTFMWRSVLLTGAIDRVEDAETVAVDAEREPWRPHLIRAASDAESTALYRFEIADWSGIEHVGLPPGFESPPSE